jgi:processive 1,2-diacylglycerol beta-glucosyltransferase
MPSKKLLLLSVSAGAGHTRAAEAIRSHAHTHRPDVSVVHLDVMDFVTAGFRKVYTDFYLRLVNKHPELWRYLYHVTNDAEPGSNLQKMRRMIERLNMRALSKEIAAFAPDAIVCTHFLPAEILSRMIRKEKMNCPVWVQVTDFDLHRMWVHDHMTGYFAANEEVAFRMQAQGIAAHRIHVTGIPIMPTFAGNLSREECAARFNLDPARTTVLLMSGGAGLGRLDVIAENLLELHPDFQMIVIAGKNVAALAGLQALSKRYPQRLLPMGFTDQIPQLMACADLAVTKPGGLTTSECLAMGLPMIVNAPIPGQEERNADYLLEQGVALKAFDSVTLAYRLRHLLDNPDVLAQMRARALRLGRAAAAAHVLDKVLVAEQTQEAKCA